MGSRSPRGKRAAAAAPRGSRRAALLDNRVVRALTAHRSRSAALLLGLVVLAYLWPALIEGHVLAPTALLYAEPPWQAVAPHGIGRWLNGDLGDVPYAYYAWDVLARQLIHAGTFPAWNPYAFAGTPLWANSQIAWLSPFSLPLWLLPLNYGLGVAAAFKLWVAGFGTYLLGRELRLGFWPALAAGVAFALCSFNVVWLSYGVFVSVVAMLPWGLWLVERVLQRGRAGDGLALAAVLAVALLGGHPGTQVHVLAATALYAVARASTLEDAGRRDRVVRLALVGGALAVALLLAAVVLLPAEHASVDTVGAAVRAHGAPLFGGSRMPAGVARTALFPDWWGRPSEGVFAGPLAGPSPVSYRERTFYAGAATLVLALVALCSPGAWRRKAPFVLLGAFGLAIAVRVPVIYDVVIGLPGFDRVQNSRIYVLLLLALAVLGGFGLQRIADARGRLGPAWAAFALAAIAAVVAVVTVAPDGSAWASALEQAVHRSRTRNTDVLALASVLWFAAVAATTAAIVLLLRARPVCRSGALALVVLVIALDVLHVAHGYQPIGPASVTVPPRTGAIAYLEQRRDEGRIAGIAAFDADWPAVYGLRDVRGSDSPLPTRRFFRLWRLMDPTAEPYRLTNLTELGPRILGLLGARWLLLPPGAQPRPPGLRAAYAGADATIYENRLAAPRAFVARDVRVVGGADEEFAALGEAGFDPRRMATLRRAELAGPAPPASGAGGVRVTRDDGDAVTLHAQLARPGLVVLDDTWESGWSVAVDGRTQPPLRVNAVLRGVAVPAGAHEIAWRYRVPGLRLGALLSALGLGAALAWAAAVVLGARRARRRQRGGSVPPPSTKPRPLSSAT